MSRWAWVAGSLVLLAIAATACSGSDTADQAASPTPVAVVATATPVALPDPTAEPTRPATATATDEPTAEPTPAPTVAAADAGPTFTPFAVDSTIDTVDFRNGFTYASSVAGGELTVTDGEAIRPDTDPLGFAQLSVLDVAFGDLDGDGLDDAAVTTVVNTGGSGNFSSVGVYQIRDGMLHLVGETDVGDRAFGGVYDADIIDEALIVENFWTDDAACCPTALQQTVWVLDGSTVLPVERFAPRAWLPAGDGGEPRELFFLPNTSAAIVAFFPEETSGAFAFTARSGQRLYIDSVDGPRPVAVAVTDATTNELVALGDAGIEAGLPADGRYRVDVDLGSLDRERTSLRVVVLDGPTGSLPTWRPRHERVVHRVDPLVETLLTWPVLESGGEPSTLTGINDEIESFVRSELDRWLAALDVDDAAEIPSEFEFLYEVALVAPDLISIHFDWYEYVCCRPYPNYGSRALVVDLTAGRLLEQDEIVEPNRLDDLQQVWLDVLERDQGLLLPERGDGIGFTTLTLEPSGIRIGTDRGVLGGAALGAPSALVTFEELGDLVDRRIVGRARAGAVPTGRFAPLAPTVVPSPTPTPAIDPADIPPESRTLAGRRGLTLQWISWEPEEWGAVEFAPIGIERYAVSGRQDGPDGDYVRIEGVISKLSDLELDFDGVVEVRVSFNNDGRVCVRDGPLQFLSTAGRRFWRMQDLLNCDGIVTDYVDIYFD